MNPAPDRQKRSTSKELLRTHWDVLAAADFFSIEVWTAAGVVRYLAETVGGDAGVLVGPVAAIRFLNKKAGSSGAPRPTE